MGTQIFYILEWLKNSRVHESWWAFNLILWYCGRRDKNLPRGRCQFGHTLLIKIPIYVMLGLVFKAMLSPWKLGKPLLRAVVKPVGWVFRTIGKTNQKHQWLVRTEGCLFFVIWLLIALYLVPREDDGAAVTSGALISSYVALGGIPLLVWALEPVARKLTPLWEVGQEASTSFSTPTPLRMGKGLIRGIKAIPEGAGVVVGLGAVVVTSTHDWWRKVCPTIEYVDDTDPHGLNHSAN